MSGGPCAGFSQEDGPPPLFRISSWKSDRQVVMGSCAEGDRSRGPMLVAWRTLGFETRRGVTRKEGGSRVAGRSFYAVGGPSWPSCWEEAPIRLLIAEGHGF